MYQEMNNNIRFILGEKSLIIEIVEENKDSEISEGRCISIIQESNIINKLYDILSYESGLLVLADHIIINKQNDLLVVTLLMDSGKCMRWKKTLTEADLVALISIVSNDRYFVMGSRYE